MSADRILRAGREQPAEAEAAPVCAPVTADTWRHLATSDDSESGAKRHVAMASDITRHVGWGLQNRGALSAVLVPTAGERDRTHTTADLTVKSVVKMC
jgi:hypothetical protein